MADPLLTGLAAIVREAGSVTIRFHHGTSAYRGYLGWMVIGEGDTVEEAINAALVSTRRYVPPSPSADTPDAGAYTWQVSPVRMTEVL